MNLRMIVGLALKASIAFTVFGFGLDATREDVLYLLRRPRVLVRSLVAMFVIMPLFAILMTRLASFNRAVVIALIALAISPVPPLLPKKLTKSGGHEPYGLGLMVTAASFSVVFVPLAVYLIGKCFHRPFAMEPGAVAKLVVFSVLAPLAAGIVFRKVAPTTAERMADPLTRVAGIVLLAGVLCILAFSLPAMWALIGNGTILAFIAFAIVALAAGHLLAGPASQQRVTLALSTASRHPALAVAICGCKYSGRTPCDSRSSALHRRKRSDYDSIHCMAAQKRLGSVAPGQQIGQVGNQEFRLRNKPNGYIVNEKRFYAHWIVVMPGTSTSRKSSFFFAQTIGRDQSAEIADHSASIDVKLVLPGSVLRPFPYAGL